MIGEQQIALFTKFKQFKLVELLLDSLKQKSLIATEFCSSSLWGYLGFKPVNLLCSKVFWKGIKLIE